MNFIKSVNNKEFRFFKMPKFIFESEKYAHLKSEDIVLYSVILDGISLSASNGEDFKDEDGSLYTILTIERAVGYTRMSEKSVRNSFKRLKEAGLIYIKRMGLQKPNRIFVYDIESLNGSSYHSGTVTATGLEWSQLPPNNTDLNNTDLNDLKDTAMSEQPTKPKQSPPQEKPKRYTALRDGGMVSKIYADAYEQVFKEKHKDVEENELNRLEELIEGFIEENNVDYIDFEGMLLYYFENLTNKNNGTIHYLAKDNRGYVPLLKRLLDDYTDTY